MALIDVDALLVELSPDAPCGEDLGYDPAMFELERLAQGTEEQQVGDAVIEAAEPDWRDVGSRALELAQRSKDLRLCLYLSMAALQLEGLPGLRDGLALLRGVLERHWDTVYPQLDPEEANDPTERMNILASFAEPEGSYGDPVRFIRRIHQAQLTDSRQLGRFTMRDILLATGELGAPAESETPPPDMAVINGAFEDTDAELLQANAQAAAEASEHVAAIDAFLTERVGASEAVNFASLQAAVDQVGRVLQEQLARLGIGAGAVAPAAAPPAGPVGVSAQPLAGEIRSRADVLAAIDKICRYYEAHEPSSPVPLLLRRAQRLVDKKFMEVIRDLSPDAITQIQLITGIDTSAEEQ